MNWRRTVLTGILAAGLTQASLPFVSTAWADNDHDHDKDHHWYHDQYDRDHDHDRWWRGLHERIHYDHEQARIIEPTGRHKKALQWYRDDIQNAENDLRTCRR